MLDKILVISGIVISLVVGAVIFSQMVPITGDIGRCNQADTYTAPSVFQTSSATYILKQI